jgi:tRNA modification GTPase
MNTIVALSTPRGRGALAVIRLSGPDSLKIAREMLVGHPDLPTRRASLHKVQRRGSDSFIDEVIATAYRAPRSVTGEDLVEISCHGATPVIRQIIALCLELGAELAGPGEFSLRALVNGKINLAQAEAIRDLIAAQTDAAVKQATRQMGGELSGCLAIFKNKLIEVIVLLESALEFVEDDLPDVQFTGIVTKLEECRKGVIGLAASYERGRLLFEGAKVTIAGAPNAGKSSVFNMLMAHNRAIVTEIPGTTRDTLTEVIDLDGIPVALTDTAGLREASDVVEVLGIERTRQSMADADLLLLVVDASASVSPEELLPIGSDNRFIVVANKSDLPSFDPNQPSLREIETVQLSTRTEEGLKSLRTAILHALTSSSSDSGSLIITNARHHQLLESASNELGAALQLLAERRSEELVLVPLQNALRLLGEITGETTTEDILTEIFSTFCIGK